MAASHWVHDLISRRPAAAGAVVFILGITLHRALPHWPLVWLILLLLALAGAILLFRRRGCSSGLLAIAVLFSGVVAAQLAAFYYPPSHVSAFVGDEPRLGWVEGRVQETPRVIEPPPRGRTLPDRQLFTLEVSKVRTWAGWVPAAGQVPVSVSPPQPRLQAGQNVRILGRLERPPTAMNPGAADPAALDRRRRVLVTLHVSRPYDIDVISQRHPWAIPLTGLRDDFRRLLDDGFSPNQGSDRALLRALVFGDREPALRQIEEAFSRTGTTHLLAANGARIAILAAFLYFLCRLLRLPPRWTLGLVTALVAGFGFLTMPAAQAIRPVLICAALGAGLMSRRSADSIQLLSLAALGVLVPRPLDLCAAGFQLSFVIVLGLILFARPVLQFLRTFEDKDRRIVKRLTPQSTWKRGVDRLRRWLIEASAAGLVAWVVALPLVAYHFEQFNAWTVPFSLLLSPLAMLALVCGFAKFALTAVCPPLAVGWAAAAWVPAASLRHAVGWLAHVPGADLPAAPPAVWQILLFYALLAVPLISWPRRRIQLFARFVPGGACAVLALPLFGFFAPPIATAGGVRITLLWVGAGQCAVVEPTGGGVVLLDAGSSTVSDPLRTCLGPFLRYERERSVDSVWLSHGDYDHISAARDLVPQYCVRAVRTSPHFRRHAHESKPCEALLAMLDRTRHSPLTVVAGDRLAIGDGIGIEVLWPPADCPFNSNNTGLVLRLTCGGRSILFPADIQESAERELLKHPQRLRSDVLVAPHHGSDEPTTADFIRAVDPKVILSSNDWRLTRKQRLFETDIDARPLYRTSRCGAITAEIGKDGSIRITPYLSGRPIVLYPR